MAKADVDLGSRITVRNDLAELEAEKYIRVCGKKINHEVRHIDSLLMKRIFW